MTGHISIIMATYNRGHYIEESLKYIANQSYTNFECLIIDDGSTDDTATRIYNLVESDPRFKYFHRPGNYKKGLPGSRNYGLDLAVGEYVVFFDDDDIPHPDLLNWSLLEIQEYDVSYCRYMRDVFYGDFHPGFHRIRDYTVKNLEGMPVEKLITGEVPFNSCQVVWKKECFKELRFNETLMFAEEWDLYSRILLKGFSGISIEVPLYFGRKHTQSNTGEYINKDKVRMDSKVNAALSIITHLNGKGSKSNQLMKFFLRLALSLNSYTLLQHTLRYFDLPPGERIIYKLGFWTYPVLQPIFRLKGKLKSI